MPTSAPPDVIAKQVVDVDLEQEAPDSFMPYALSVITGRAIPDIRDGLIPVQRRILYTMFRLGLDPASSHRKSAGIVGEVMGKYHPHGDSAIYGAMVRMGQDVVAQLPFVDPRGNFGGLDDPPAAYRYTEARLSEAAMSMLAGINQNAVDMTPTFDGERDEPTVLPANLPNLLVNGPTGIAVGVSTSIPPHNLGEVVKAVRKWMMSPEGRRPTVAALMKIIPGPDYPSGGVLTGEIESAYKTGQGRMRLRARCKVEKGTARRRQIVFDELPHHVGPESVIAAVRKAVDAQQLKGVSEVSNTSGEHGAQVTVLLMVGADPNAVAESLYSKTPLEKTVSMNAVALIDGAPRVVDLRSMISHYADHLSVVTKRRAQHDLDNATARAHILRGLIAAVSMIEEVVAAIRASKDTPAARAALMALLDVDEEQADAVLEMRLRRLNALEETELRRQLEEQEAIIADRTEIVTDDKRLRDEAVKTMEASAKGSIRPRRTELA